MLSHVTGQVFMRYHGVAIFEARQLVESEQGATLSDIEKTIHLSSTDSNEKAYDAKSKLLSSSVVKSDECAEFPSDPSRHITLPTTLSEAALSVGERTSNESSDEGKDKEVRKPKTKANSNVSNDSIELHSDTPFPSDELFVLHKEVFCQELCGELTTFGVRDWVNPAVLLVSAASVAALIVGSNLPVFSFEAAGFIADLVEQNREFSELRETRSVFSLAQLLLSEALLIGDAKKLIGMGLLSFLLIVVVVVAPIVHVGSLLTQWFHPLNVDQLRRVNRMSEILHVWQCADVFLLSAILSAVQLSSLSEFVIGKYCEGLAAGVEVLENAGLLNVNGRTCYAASGSVKVGAVFLLVAVCLISALRLFVVEAVRQKLQQADDTTTVASIRVNKDYDANALSIDKETALRQINPPKVSFVDRFRWFLRPVAELISNETRL
jgi:Paraquat-inducible protein A